MTRKQALRVVAFEKAMATMGIEFDDMQALRRIEMTLHRWSEHECNGTIQREGDAGDGAPRYYYENMRTGKHIRGPIVPDRERGALKRLEKIMAKYPTFKAYHQGDPRGCALYLVPVKDLEGGKDISTYYSRGFAVCY